MISIIVPIYNADKYLDRTINSILTQTYDDFELLLIDDGSFDNSSLICQQYIAKDKRIRYYLKENGGPSSARNLGMKKAEGEFISFVDADDVVESNFLETLLMPFRNNSNIDLTVASYQKNEKKVILPNKIVNSHRVIRDACKQDYIMGYVVNKLFRSSVIHKHQLKFDESINFSEDLLFTVNYLLKIENVKYVSDIIYHYMFQTNSLSTKFDEDNPFRDTMGILKVMELLNSQNIVIKDNVLRVYQRAYIRALTGVIINNRQRLKKREFLWAKKQLPKNSLKYFPHYLIVLKTIISKIIILFKT